MMGSVPDTSIERARVRAPAAQTAAAVAGLERASWPQAQSGEWVFVRTLTVRAAVPWIGQRAAESATARVQAAVSGAAPKATEADAVRFSSLTDLLAWLSADLAAGRAARCWYWRRWMRLFELPPGEAVLSLWEEHIEYLPAVCASLARQQNLTNVWRHLDATSAAKLVSALARTYKLAATGPDAQPQTRRHAVKVAVPDYQLRRWRAPLAGLPANDSRATLSALLVCLECRPATLLANTSRRVAQVAESLTPDTATNPESEVQAVQRAKRRRVIPHIDGRDGQARHQAGEVRANYSEGANRAALFERDDTDIPVFETPDDCDAAPASISETHQPVGGLQNNRLAKPATNPVSAAETVAAPLRSRRADQGPAFFDGFEFLTEEGGLFYLINVLRRTEIRELMERHDAWNAAASGWVWLLALGRAIGLDESGSLAKFLIEQTTEVEGDEFAGADPEVVEEAIVLARSLYKESAVSLDDLLPLRARVCLTETHLDVHLPSSAVRLSVRLAGLDINPGWVDWLGRVVTFHYVDEGSPLLPGAP